MSVEATSDSRWCAACGVWCWIHTHSSTPNTAQGGGCCRRIQLTKTSFRPQKVAHQQESKSSITHCCRQALARFNQQKDGKTMGAESHTARLAATERMHAGKRENAQPKRHRKENGRKNKKKFWCEVNTGKNRYSSTSHAGGSWRHAQRC